MGPDGHCTARLRLIRLERSLLIPKTRNPRAVAWYKTADNICGSVGGLRACIEAVEHSVFISRASAVQQCAMASAHNTHGGTSKAMLGYR